MHPTSTGSKHANNTVPEVATEAESASKPEHDPKQADADSKPCIACRESIQRDASVCVHCKSAQDWTRHILRWTAVWTAALALLPLWSGALALREIAFPNHKAAVKFHPISCTKEVVILAVTNSGDRPGIISEFSLNILVDNRLAKETFDLIPRTERRVVLPGETFTLELEPRVEGVLAPLPTPKRFLKTCEYRILTRVAAFDLSAYPTTVSCPCAGSMAGNP